MMGPKLAMDVSKVLESNNFYIPSSSLQKRRELVFYYCLQLIYIKQNKTMYQSDGGIIKWP